MKKVDCLALVLSGLFLCCLGIGVMLVLQPAGPLPGAMALSTLYPALPQWGMGSALPTPTALAWQLPDLPTLASVAGTGTGCSAWDSVDSSDAGRTSFCVTGTVQALGASGAKIFFSSDPRSFYVFRGSDAPAGLRPGDCIQAQGTVTKDASQRLYLNAAPQGVAFCP